MAISLILGYAINEITGSAFWVGVNVAAMTVPCMLLSFTAGWILDRVDRRKVLLVLYGACTAFGLALWIHATSDAAVPVGEILVASVIIGVLTTFIIPVNWIVLCELAPRRLLPDVIALSSTVSDVLVAACMFVGGIALVNAMTAYLFVGYAAAAFSVVTVVLLRFRPRRLERFDAGSKESLFAGIRIAVGVAREYPRLRLALTLTPAVAVLLLPLFEVMAPLADWSGEVINPAWYGGAACGGCALVMLGLALSRRLGITRSRVVIVLLCTSAVVLGATAVAGHAMRPVDRMYVIIPTLVLVGLATATIGVLLTSTIEMHAPEQVRGHVLGLYGQLLIGVLPIGTLIWGAVIDLFGFAAVLALSAIGLCAIVVFLMSGVRAALLD